MAPNRIVYNVHSEILILCVGMVKDACEPGEYNIIIVRPYNMYIFL